jgi:predicted RNA binding protein YcfA (HicA-like mRNA interferase family)
MSTVTKVERILAEQGFSLVRQKKHRVYRDGAGRTLVTASTPSDWRSERNILRNLSRVVGLSKRELLEQKRTKPTPVAVTPVAVAPVVEAFAPVVETAIPTAATPTPTCDLRLQRELKRLEKREAKLAARERHENEEALVAASALAGFSTGELSILQSVKEFIPDFSYSYAMEQKRGRDCLYIFFRWGGREHTLRLEDDGHGSAFFWDRMLIGAQRSDGLQLRPDVADWWMGLLKDAGRIQ